MSHINLCTHRKHVAQGLVALPVALRNLNIVVCVVIVDLVVSHILDAAETTAAVEKILELGLNARPDFDSCAVAGIGHGDIIDEDILDNVHLAFVLPQGANTDTVGTNAR